MNSPNYIRALHVSCTNRLCATSISNPFSREYLQKPVLSVVLNMGHAIITSKMRFKSGLKTAIVLNKKNILLGCNLENCAYPI